jgi:hypothetical protein
MEYIDFYDIAAHGNIVWKGNFTPREVACNAYDYKVEYDYSKVNGKPTHTMIELCKLICTDMNWVEVSENILTIEQMDKILKEYWLEI